MLTTLRLQSEAISLEAFSLKASVTAVTHAIPQFIKNVGDFVHRLELNKTRPIGLVQDAGLQKRLKDIKYADVRQIEVFGPQGMKGTYLDYIKALEASVVLAEHLEHSVLAPFATWLAIRLSTPEALGSPRDNANPVAVAGQGVEKAMAEFEKQANKANTQSSYPYGRVVQRNTDWKEVVQNTNALSTRFLNTKPEAVRLKVEQIVADLNTLIVRMEEDPETYKLSGITASALAKQCYTLGREVEYYSITGALVQELSSTVQETVNRLEKTFSR